MNRWVLVFAFVGLLLPQSSAVNSRPVSAVPGAEGWLRVRTRNFTLIGNASEKDIRQAGSKLEQFRAAVTRLLTADAQRQNLPVTVIVFKGDSDFQPFKPLYQGNPADVSGYFQTSDDQAYIALAADGQQTDPYRIIFHEYSHLLTGDRRGRLPVWVSEGLAEYYSTFSARTAQQIRLGGPLPAHAQLLRRQPWLSLTTVFAVAEDSPYYTDGDKKRQFYAVSWALMHYLMTGKDGRYQDRLSDFLQLLRAGKATPDALRQVWQIDVATLEAEFRQFLRNNSFPVQEISFAEKIEFDERAEVAPLSEPETQAYLGDLLWRIHRTAEGEQLLQRAIAQNAKLPVAHFALGKLRLQRQQLPEAKEHFRQAAEADPQHYLARYFYAFTLQQQYVDEYQFIAEFPDEATQRMRAALDAARQLAPDFPDTYRLLAFINLVRQEQLPEAVTLMQQALRLAPERQDFVYTLAQVYLRQNQFGAARTVAERIIVYGEPARIVERAKWLLGSIADAERAHAASEALAKQKADAAALAAPGRRFTGEQVEGWLTRIDCTDNSVTLTVNSEMRTFKFHAAQRGDLIFVRYTIDVPVEITCGALLPARKVIVTYRSATQIPAHSDGEPVGVEFLKAGSS